MEIGTTTSKVTTPQLACELCGDGSGNVELQRCKLTLLQHCKLTALQAREAAALQVREAAALQARNVLLLQLALRQRYAAVAARVAATLRSSCRCCSSRRGNTAQFASRQRCAAHVAAALLQQALL